MSSININDSNRVLVLTKDDARQTKVFFEGFRLVPGALDAANTEFGLALGRNQIEALEQPGNALIERDGVLILTGEVVSAYRAFLYGVQGHEIAKQIFYSDAANRIFMANLTREILGL